MNFFKICCFIQKKLLYLKKNYSSGNITNLNDFFIKLKKVFNFLYDFDPLILSFWIFTKNFFYFFVFF